MNNSCMYTKSRCLCNAESASSICCPARQYLVQSERAFQIRFFARIGTNCLALSFLINFSKHFSGHKCRRAPGRNRPNPRGAKKFVMQPLALGCNIVVKDRWFCFCNPIPPMWRTIGPAPNSDAVPEIPGNTGAPRVPFAGQMSNQRIVELSIFSKAIRQTVADDLGFLGKTPY